MTLNYKLKQLFLPVALVASVCSCKKAPDLPVINYEEQRIAAVTDQANSHTAAFTYDEQKRLSRIDYNYDNNVSLRFVYDAQTITATFYQGTIPDLQRSKYVYTLLNNRIVNTRMTKPNGVVHDTQYDYDASGRMTETVFRIIQNGNLIAKLDCYYTYPQNNIQEINLYGARGSATDTLKLLRTYDLQRRFFAFSNIGFDFFGTFSTGVSYRLSGLTEVVEPFPFFTSTSVTDYSPLILSENVMIKQEGEGKRRDLSDPINNGWQQVDFSNEYEAAQFQYDESNRLTGCYSKYSITWQ